MFQKFIKLEFKSFLRAPGFSAGLFMKILSVIGIIYLSFMFVLAAFGLYSYAEEEAKISAVRLFSQYFIYYYFANITLRYVMQQLSTQNIKPFLTMNIPKKTVVNYTLFKSFTSFFNWGNLLFLVPFSVLLIYGGASFYHVTLWFIGITSLLFFNNFLNFFLNGKDYILYPILGVLGIVKFLDYKKYLSLTDISERIFYPLFTSPLFNIIPIFLLILLGIITYRYIFNDFYLDKGLEVKKKAGKTENIQFLNRFGKIGTFMNNDIRLLKRSKTAKGTLIASFLFLFYGLLLFNPAYHSDFMRVFLGIFVTGGFLFVFGQRVPAWDSSCYPLMMTQNIPYKEYLKAKWTLMCIATAISMVLAAFYILVDKDIYFTFLAAGFYNLGVNSQITLLSGAFNKNAVDLDAGRKSMSGKNNFNLKNLLLTIPRMIIPMAVYAVVKYFAGTVSAVLCLAILGLIGFLFRDKFFDLIVKMYKKEKYTTIAAFKQKN